MFYFVNQYVVRSGDTLNKIARAAELLNVRQLLPVNPQIMNPDLIYPGQVINIPRIIPMTTYFVKPGDTLYSIISNYNVELMKYYGVQITLNEVLAYNPGIVNPNLIYPEMVIYLPEIL
jgi:nucleoid-associated protein YgaU